MTPLTRKAAPSLSACLSVFQLDVKSRRLSPKTIRFYDQQLRYFLAWLEENGVSPDSVSITELDRNDIRQYLSDRTDSGLAAASVDACYRALNTFCNFCVRGVGGYEHLIYALQALMGHSSLEILKLYARVEV